MRKFTMLLGAFFVVFTITGCVNVQESAKKTTHDLKPDTSEQVAVQETHQDLKAEEEKEIHKMLPEPASGYVWKVFRGVAIQRPIKWHEHSEGGTYCSSVESVSENGMFETGVTVEVLRDVKKRSGKNPSLLAALMLKALDDKPENKRLSFTDNKHQDFETVVYRYRNAPPELSPIIVHKYFQVSDEKDFINIITFESTEKDWDKYWKNEGETIVDKVVMVEYDFEEEPEVK